MWIFIILLFLLLGTGELGVASVIIFGIVFVVIVAYQLCSESGEFDKRIAIDKKIMNGEIDGFVPSKSVKDVVSPFTIYIDEPNKRVMLINRNTPSSRKIYNFNELVECSILEDGATICSGGVGRAITGAIIGGGVGAIVGASTRSSKNVTLSMSVRIITSKISQPLYEIPLITSETNRDSTEYKRKIAYAQEIYATITSIIAQNK